MQMTICSYADLCSSIEWLIKSKFKFNYTYFSLQLMTSKFNKSRRLKGFQSWKARLHRQCFATRIYLSRKPQLLPRFRISKNVCCGIAIQIVLLLTSSMKHFNFKTLISRFLSWQEIWRDYNVDLFSICCCSLFIYLFNSFVNVNRVIKRLIKYIIKMGFRGKNK